MVNLEWNLFALMGPDHFLLQPNDEASPAAERSEGIETPSVKTVRVNALGRRSSFAGQLVNSQPDVLRYLPEQNGGDVSAGVEGNCRASPVGVTKLFMGTLLAHLRKTQGLKYGDNFAGLENWNVAHDQATTTF